jgi:hypothetical protein
MKFQYIIFSIITLVVFSCSKTDTTDYAGNAVCSSVPTYTSNVVTILNTNCAISGCHNSSAQAGINLSTYALASSQFKTNSKNLISIHHGSGVEAMPRNASKLSDVAINTLDCWVKNSCPQ